MHIGASTITLATFLLSVTVSAFQPGSIAKGDFTVYKNGKLVEKMTGQNPIDEESLLVCTSKCLIKSPGIALAAESGSKLAVKNQKDAFNIYFKSGLVNFVINNDTRKFIILTPEGSYTVADVFFQNSNQSSVRGYLTINKEGKTEIGVYEGRMVFTTASGKQAVDANHKFVLAISNVVVDKKKKEDDDDDRAGGTFWKFSDELLAFGGVIAFLGGNAIIDSMSSEGESAEVRTLSPHQ